MMSIISFFLFIIYFCGLSEKSSQLHYSGKSEIVGGNEAYPGEFPYMLSLQYGIFGVTFHYCGGSIYNEMWVITSANCVTGKVTPKMLKVIAGEQVISKVDGYEQSIPVQKIVIHESFNRKTYENDIALLKLKSPLKFNERVSPLPLPYKGKVFSGDCTVSGWGAISKNGRQSDVLNKAVLPLLTDDICRIYSNYTDDVIKDSMLCAGSLDGGKGFCSGDSGGPLMCEGALAGIVSWAHDCASPDYPGIYTEVSYFVDWIESNVM